jgi:hypothetical protein
VPKLQILRESPSKKLGGSSQKLKQLEKKYKPAGALNQHKKVQKTSI